MSTVAPYTVACGIDLDYSDLSTEEEFYRLVSSHLVPYDHIQLSAAVVLRRRGGWARGRMQYRATWWPSESDLLDEEMARLQRAAEIFTERSCDLLRTEYLALVGMISVTEGTDEVVTLVTTVVTYLAEWEQLVLAYTEVASGQQRLVLVRLGREEVKDLL